MQADYKNQKGVEQMCREMEEIRNEGELEKARRTALNLSRLEMSAEEIALAVEENLQLVKEWLAGQSSPTR